MAEEAEGLGLIGRVKSPHILPVQTKQCLPRRSNLSCSQSPQDICNIFEIVWLKDLSFNLSKAEMNLQAEIETILALYKKKPRGITTEDQREIRNDWN